LAFPRGTVHFMNVLIRTYLEHFVPFFPDLKETSCVVVVVVVWSFLLSGRTHSQDWEGVYLLLLYLTVLRIRYTIYT